MNIINRINKISIFRQPQKTNRTILDWGRCKWYTQKFMDHHLHSCWHFTAFFQFDIQPSKYNVRIHVWKWKCYLPNVLVDGDPEESEVWEWYGSSPTEEISKLQGFHSRTTVGCFQHLAILHVETTHHFSCLRSQTATLQAWGKNQLAIWRKIGWIEEWGQGDYDVKDSFLFQFAGDTVTCDTDSVCDVYVYIYIYIYVCVSALSVGGQVPLLDSLLTPTDARYCLIEIVAPKLEIQTRGRATTPRACSVFRIQPPSNVALDFTLLFNKS